MIAEAFSCVVFVPVDVVKERMQIQVLGEQASSSSLPVYRSSGHAIRTILKTEGLSGIYKGYGATLASFGPFSALYFLFYEEMKKAMASFNSSLSSSHLPLTHTILASSGAGLLASFLTTPLDLVKLRLQVQRASRPTTSTISTTSAVTTYRGVWHALTSIYKQEGFKHLFRGGGARMLFHAPSTAVTLTSYEYVKQTLIGKDTN